MNNFRKVLYTEPCPNFECGVLIQKNGGCPHMKCAKCNYEFCWKCKGKFFAYSHEDAAACSGINLFKTALISMLIFMSLSCIIYRSGLNPQAMLLFLIYKGVVLILGLA